MKVFLCLISVLFGGLSLIAAISQIKSEKSSPSALIMTAGSLLLIAAVICNMAGQPLDLLLAFPGCAAICAAAIMNGVKSQQLHLPHHIIRIFLSAILVIGFAVL